MAGPYVIRCFKILFHVFQPQPTKVNHLLHHLVTIKFFIGENQPVPWCHIRHVKATHIVCHLFWTTPSKQQYECRKKYLFGVCGNTIDTPSHERHSHHIGMILSHLKNKWEASSSSNIHIGHLDTCISTFLHKRLILVGILSLNSHQLKCATLLGTFNFHNLLNTPLSSPASPQSPLLHWEFYTCC